MPSPQARGWLRLAVLLVSFCSFTVFAQPFPSKPIRVIGPFAAGGSLDVVSRLVSTALSNRLKQPIVVENRTGAGGTIGAAFVAKSPADGYTLLVSNNASNAMAASLYAKLPYDALNDFEHIAMIGTAPVVLLVNADLPVKSLGDLIAALKAKPKEMIFGSGGVGTSLHLAGEMLKAEAGVDFVHVPYKGGAPALQDLMGGHVAFLFDNITTAAVAIQGRKVRALGVAGLERAPKLPDVPTLKEQGHAIVAEAWYGFSAPARTPADVVAMLNAELKAVIADPIVQARLVQEGMSPAAFSPAEYRRFIAAEIDRWREVVKASGVKAE